MKISTTVTVTALVAALTGCSTFLRMTGKTNGADDDRRMWKADAHFDRCELDQARAELKAIQSPHLEQKKKDNLDVITQTETFFSKLPDEQPARARAQWTELLRQSSLQDNNVVRVCMEVELAKALESKPDDATLFVSALQDAWWSSLGLQRKLNGSKSVIFVRDTEKAFKDAADKLGRIRSTFKPDERNELVQFQAAVNVIGEIASKVAELEEERADLDSSYKKGEMSKHEYNEMQRDLKARMKQGRAFLGESTVSIEGYIKGEQVADLGTKCDPYSSVHGCAADDADDADEDDASPAPAAKSKARDRKPAKTAKKTAKKTQRTKARSKRRASL